jgi:IS1 family transposase
MNTPLKFLEDLKALLEKYKLEITCDDHWKGYSECGEDLRITLEFYDYSMGDNIEFKDSICISDVNNKIKELSI